MRSLVHRLVAASAGTVQVRTKSSPPYPEEMESVMRLKNGLTPLQASICGYKII